MKKNSIIPSCLFSRANVENVLEARTRSVLMLLYYNIELL